MDKERFSLLLLEPGEIYFEDFSCMQLGENDENPRHGRLKMCSKSLVFDPRDIALPIVKIPLKDCTKIEAYRGSDPNILQHSNVLSVATNQHIELLASNIVAPYSFKGAKTFIFVLNYAKVPNCLTHISQLQRAATLLNADQNAMIATIVHSRHARFKFDPLWMKNIHEKIFINTRADKISPLVVNPGRVVLSNERFYFQPYNNVESYTILKLELGNIKRLITRRFLLRHVGLEIHYVDENQSQSLIYLAFRSKSDRDDVYNQLLAQPTISLDKYDQDMMTLQWQNGVISNFEYLMYLNSAGDRTFNDLTQYPIFPWILTDYTSQTIDLSNEKIYRDLTKPIGALNPERFHKLLDRYSEMSSRRFMYGSHYSAPGLVLFYLVRKFPHYMLCLQNGRFDHPDRMFNSVADVFRNCMSNMSDFKELIPEFYDTEQKGSFLVNTKGIHFGYRSDGTKVADVKLPPWAESPEHFVRTLREALESEYVSQNLNHWIDLIFGYKQRGAEAEKAHNLFYYLCYEGAVDLDSIKDINERHAFEVQIMEFGQIPKQLFTVPHPQRKSKMSSLSQSLSLNDCGDRLETDRITGMDLYQEFVGHKEKISSILIGRDNDTIFSVGHDSILKMFSRQNKKQLRSSSVGTMALSSLIQLQDNNTLIIGSWDDSIILYDVKCGRISHKLRVHDDAVSVIAWSGNETNLLATGSWDCSIRLWKGLNEAEQRPPRPAQNIVGEIEQESQITALVFSPDSKQLASGTQDGDVSLWNVTNRSLLFQLESHNSSVTALRFSPDGEKLITCSENGLFRLIDLKTRMIVFQKTLESKLLSMDWNGEILILGTDQGEIYVWDMIEVKLILCLQAHQGPINCIAMSSADFVVTGSQDRTIKIWYFQRQM